MKPGPFHRYGGPVHRYGGPLHGYEGTGRSPQDAARLADRNVKRDSAAIPLPSASTELSPAASQASLRRRILYEWSVSPLLNTVPPFTIPKSLARQSQEQVPKLIYLKFYIAVCHVSPLKYFRGCHVVLFNWWLSEPYFLLQCRLSWDTVPSWYAWMSILLLLSMFWINTTCFDI